jgi:uncharacterized protein YjcR
LFLGTHQDNVTDMVTKKRQSCGKGERSAMAKITADDARFIYQSSLPNKDLVTRFGITKDAIQKIKDRSSWAAETQGLELGLRSKAPKIGVKRGPYKTEAWKRRNGLI